MEKISTINFGMALRHLRKEQNLSQEKLAAKCNLDPSYICLLERNLKTPRLDTIISLSIGLGVNASEMIIRMEKLMKMKG